MTGGARFFLFSSCLAAAGCTAAAQDVKVRPIADPAAKFRYGGSLIAQGRAQLALGNAGLALETFRKAQREQPESADAFAGIAACYAAMGRYDLTRANYEFALAYAPNDPALLNALASTLDRLGRGEQAAEVRREAARLAVRPASTQVAQAAATPIAVPKVGSVVVKLPDPKPAVVAKKAPVVPTSRPQLAATAASVPAAIAPILTAPTPKPQTNAAAPEPEPRSVALAMSKAPAPPAIVQRVTTIAPAASTIVELPPARPAVVTAQALAANVLSAAREPVQTPAAKLPEPVAAPQRPDPAPPAALVPPVKPQERRVARIETPVNLAPRLERLSPGVVSLVTTLAPVQVADLRGSRQQAPAQVSKARAEQSTPPAQPAPRRMAMAEVRWMPLKYASAPANIQLLNAARSDGLAARTRVALADRGWRRIRIGNARQVRQHSLVLYSPERASVGRRLAAQLRCKALLRRGVNSVIVLLGRDSARRRSAASRA